MFGIGKQSMKTKNHREEYEPIPDHDNDSYPDLKELPGSDGTTTQRVVRSISIIVLCTVFLFVVVLPSMMVSNRRSPTIILWEDLLRSLHWSGSNAVVVPILMKHRESLPTFLSLMQKSDTTSSLLSSPLTTSTNNSDEYEYVYALDNLYYDFVTEHFDSLVNTITDVLHLSDHDERIWIHWSMISQNEERLSDPRHKLKQQQQSYETRQSSTHSMLIQWHFMDDSSTMNTDHDDSNDLLAFFCNNHQNKNSILEVATLPQVRSTHQKAMTLEYNKQRSSIHEGINNDSTTDMMEFWYVPNVPSSLFRQKECYWVYLYYTGGDFDKNDITTTGSTTLNIKQYIPMGISNRYDMSTIQNILQPTNIHLALTSQSDAMMIQFTSGGDSVVGTPIVEYSIEIMKHRQQLRQHQPSDHNDDDVDDDNTTQTSWSETTTTASSTTTRVSGTTDTYTASDMCQEPANITGPGKFMSPGNLHTVLLTNLQTNTMYTYRVGIETGQGVIWNSHSGTFQTAMQPPTGENDDDATQSFTFLVYGDQGCPASGWDDGQLMIEGMVNREVYLQSSSSSVPTTPVRMIHHVGDLSYAQGAAHIWDAWLDMIQPISMYVPIMIAVGNHEYDHMSGGSNGKDPSKYVTTDSGFMPVWGNFANDSGGECGVPTTKRFTMPASNVDNNDPAELQSNGVFWYWYDYGLLRTIVLSSEHDLSEGSIQHIWLEHILFNTNRTITPWVIVELHRPLYEMEEALFPNPQHIGIAMRYEFEDLLHDYNVDIVFSGHFHTYHRTCDGLYRSQCQNGGPVHITIGTAGAHLNEVMSLNRQPRWTDEIIFQTYGYGRVTVVNRTAIHFEFIKAGNELYDTTAGTVLDDVYIIRDENR